MNAMRWLWLVVVAAGVAHAEEPVLTSGGEGFLCAEVDAETIVHAEGPGGLATEVKTANDVFFVADGRAGFVTLTLKNGKPKERARLRFGDDYVKSVALDGRGRAWVAGENFAVAVVDVSRAPALKLLGTFGKSAPFVAAPSVVEAEGNVLWAATPVHLAAYDVREPLAPKLLVDLAHEFQDTLSLRRVGGLLVAEFVAPQGGGAWRRVARLFDVRDPSRLVALEPDLMGHVLLDGEHLFVFSKSDRAAVLSRVEVDLAKGSIALERLGELAATDEVLAVADEKVFVNHNARGLEVLALPAFDFVGSVLGNFQTGFSDVARAGPVLATATRFGGTQFIDLRTLGNRSTPSRRFKGMTIRRSPSHGDVLTFIVMPGDTVSGIMKRHGLTAPAATWLARIKPIQRLNHGGIENLDVIRPGQLLAIPIPARVFCRP